MVGLRSIASIFSGDCPKSLLKAEPAPGHMAITVHQIETIRFLINTSFYFFLVASLSILFVVIVELPVDSPASGSPQILHACVTRLKRRDHLKDGLVIVVVFIQNGLNPNPDGIIDCIAGAD